MFICLHAERGHDRLSTVGQRAVLQKKMRSAGPPTRLRVFSRTIVSVTLRRWPGSWASNMFSASSIENRCLLVAQPDQVQCLTLTAQQIRNVTERHGSYDCGTF